MGNPPSFKEAPAPAQDDPFFFEGKGDYLFRREAAVEGRVESHHSQIPRQPAEMDIQYKPDLSQGIRADPAYLPDIEGLENRVDADPVSFPD